MQNPTTQAATAPPRVFQTCGSGQRNSIGNSRSNSTEFEFWRVGNHTQPQHDLLSADQLFLDGVILPLHLLHLKQTNHEEEAYEQGPELTSTYSTDEKTNNSKRWTDIFKRSEKKSSILAGCKTEDKRKDKQRREKRGSAELNINLWPFLRSRSEGNSGGVQPRWSPGGHTPRRVSSAPCSRSNSGGEPTSRKWPGSPACPRPGLHLGRTSPVWQVKRSPRASMDSVEPRRHMNKFSRGGGSRKAARVLNLNVPMYSGYRHHLVCSTDDNVCVGRVMGIGNVAGGGGHGVYSGSRGSTAGNMFNFRSLFTKKVH